MFGESVPHGCSLSDVTLHVLGAKAFTVVIQCFGCNADGFTRKEYEKVLMTLLEMAGSQPGVMTTDEIMRSLETAKKEGLMKLIEDLTLKSGSMTPGPVLPNDQVREVFVGFLLWLGLMAYYTVCIAAVMDVW